MKKNLRLISLVLLICMSVMCVTGFASSNTSVSYDPATGLVAVNSTANGHTVIRTAPFNFDISASSAGNMYTDWDQIYENGSFTYDFIMPDSAPYGKYTVYVSDSTITSDAFMYYNTSVADSLIYVLNSRTTAPNLADVIATSAATFGIDADSAIYKENSAAASEILMSGFLPFTNSTDFYNDYHGALALSACSGESKGTIEELLSKYQSNLGINYADYSALSEAHKADICSLLSSMDYKAYLTALKADGKTVSYDNLIKRVTALSAVRVASNWMEIRDAFTTGYNSVLGDIINANTSYKTSTESSVFSRLREAGSFTDWSALKKSFNDAVTFVNNQNSSSVKVPTVSSPSSVTMPSGNVISGSEYDSAQQGTSVPQVAVSFSAPVLSDSKAQYRDVYESGWEHNAVTSLGGNGIISGYPDGSFGSANNITRAEFSKLIVSAFSIKAPSVSFSDVSENDWFYPYVSVLAGAGIIQGYEGRFSPEDKISRQDAAVILYRISTKLGCEYYGSANLGDINDVSLYATTAVRSLSANGIINGDSNMNFNPHNSLTRAEAAQLLYNFIGKLNG